MPSKTASLTLTLLALTTFAQAQNLTAKDDLFAGTEKFAQGASSVTQVDMDPRMMSMVDGRDSEKARNTVLSVVHTYHYDKPGMYKRADVDVYVQKLNTGDWSCSVHVVDNKSGESTDVCARSRADGLLESAVITVSPMELTFIHKIRRPKEATTPSKPAQ